MAARRWLKRGAQLAAAAIGPRRWRVPRPGLLVLMYHRVLPRGVTPPVPVQPGMFVHTDTFEHHLRILRAHFTPVVLSEWIARARAGRPLPERAVALTFDDGWVDNFEFAFPLLQRYGVPATIFLVSDFVGTDRLFWPERLQILLAQGDSPADDWVAALLEGVRGPKAHRLDVAVQRAKAFPDREIEQRLERVEQGVRPGRQLFDWDEARTMAASGLVQFGSHTRTHARLRGELDDERLEDEIVRSKALIESRLERPVELFCYPNGETSAPAQALVRAHYRAACTTRKGWNRPADTGELQRIGIHEGVAHDDTAFMARLSGWL